MSKMSDKHVDLINDYKTVFNSEKGKSILYDLMIKCNMLNASFNGDINKMIFNEGRRSILLYILNSIDTDPEALKMHIEETLKEQEFFNID